MEKICSLLRFEMCPFTCISFKKKQYSHWKINFLKRGKFHRKRPGLGIPKTYFWISLKLLFNLHDSHTVMDNLHKDLNVKFFIPSLPLIAIMWTCHLNFSVSPDLKLSYASELDRKRNSVHSGIDRKKFDRLVAHLQWGWPSTCLINELKFLDYKLPTWLQNPHLLLRICLELLLINTIEPFLWWLH